MPKKNGQVGSDFLEKNPDIRQEGLGKGWFREETIAEQEESVSFAQTGVCDLKGMQQCGELQKRQKVQGCMREAAWQVSDKPDPDDFDDDSCKMIDSGKAIPVATPDDCLRASFAGVGKIKRRFFQCKNEVETTGSDIQAVVPHTPILCHVESALYSCRDFQRQDFGVTFFDVRGFEDFLYWIDEGKVPERLEQIAQDDARAAAALKAV